MDSPNNNYIILKGKNAAIPISSIFADCHLDLGINTKSGDSLTSILRKIAIKASSVDLSAYYTKVESDSRYVQIGSDSDWLIDKPNFYTKTEINSLIPVFSFQNGITNDGAGNVGLGGFTNQDTTIDNEYNLGFVGGGHFHLGTRRSNSPYASLHITKDTPDGFVTLTGVAPSIRMLDSEAGQSLNIVWAGVTQRNNYLNHAQIGDQVMVNYYGNFLIAAGALIRNSTIDFMISSGGNIVLAPDIALSDNGKKLQVNGSSYFSGTLQSVSLSGTGNRIVQADINGTLSASVDISTLVTTSNLNTAIQQPTGQIIYGNGTGITSNSTFVYKSGQVGIGISTFVGTEKLRVSGDTVLNGILYVTNTSNPTIQYSSVTHYDAGGTGASYPRALFNIGNSGTNPVNAGFYITPGVQSVNNSAFFGISSMPNVKGSGSRQMITQLDASGDISFYNTIGETPSSTVNWYFGGTNRGSTGGFAFMTNTSGQFGIGTATFAGTEKLRVNGNTRLDGIININTVGASGAPSSAIQITSTGSANYGGVTMSNDLTDVGQFFITGSTYGLVSGIPARSFGIYSNAPGGIVWVSDATSNSLMKFLIGGSAPANEVVRFTTSGILIGTTTDAGYKLQVNGNILANGLYFNSTTALVNATSSGLPVWMIKANNSGASFQTMNSNNNGFSGVEYIDNNGGTVVFSGYANNNPGEFRFNNIAANAYIDFMISSSSKLRIANNGNILIGTAVNTGQKLQVNGDIKVSGKANITSLPTYADDTTAGVGGLVSGDLYKTSTGQLMIKL